MRLIRPVVSDMDELAETTDHHIGRPTFFEITTAIALLYFHQQDVDLAIVEVGLGGRLDSTNVCQPCVSVITSISYDHVHLLGNTLQMIATEKAGIIKTGVPVISGVDQEKPKKTIQKIANQLGSQLWNIEDDFRVQASSADAPSGPGQEGQRFDCLLEVGSHRQTWPGLLLGLNGAHQRNNAAVAVATLACLQQQGWDISPEAIQRGLAHVRCHARIEILASHPTVVIDTAHNPASVDALVEYLKTRERPSRSILIFATSSDKDVPGMLTLLLADFDVVILTRYATNPRALAVEELERQCQLVIDQSEPFDPDTNIPFIESCQNPLAAWKRASQLAGPHDLICITGSFYLAGEMRSLVNDHLASQIAS